MNLFNHFRLFMKLAHLRITVITAGVFLFNSLMFSYGQGTGTPSRQANIIDTGIIPKAFAPGIISTPYSEWSTSFTPDDQTVYSSLGGLYWTVIYSKKRNGQWSKPEVASFSGRFKDTDPFISPDGKKIFFVSNRPWPSMPQNKGLTYTALWYADLMPGDKWGEPKLLDTAINLSKTGNYGPSVSAKGTLFYCSRHKGLTGMQSFYAVLNGDHYEQPEQLLIKGAAEIQDPFIAADESYLVFLNGDSLYISFKKDGDWGEAQGLGPVVNSGEGNSSPYVSHDGKTLYYTSSRIKDLFKRRDFTLPALNYDQLVKENQEIFNSQGNILMVPLHLERAVR